MVSAEQGDAYCKWRNVNDNENINKIENPIENKLKTSVPGALLLPATQDHYCPGRSLGGPGGGRCGLYLAQENDYRRYNYSINVNSTNNQ